MGKKTNGGKDHVDDKYIKEILYDNARLHKYEVPIILKAFKKTVQYFFNNGIEFSVRHMFDCKIVDKKESKNYVVRKAECQIIPAHKIMKIKVCRELKDYLNERNEYKNVRHRERLPHDKKRINKLF